MDIKEYLKIQEYVKSFKNQKAFITFANLDKISGIISFYKKQREPVKMILHTLQTCSNTLNSTVSAAELTEWTKRITDMRQFSFKLHNLFPQIQDSFKIYFEIINFLPRLLKSISFVSDLGFFGAHVSLAETKYFRGIYIQEKAFFEFIQKIQPYIRTDLDNIVFIDPLLQKILDLILIIHDNHQLNFVFIEKTILIEQLEFLIQECKNTSFSADLFVSSKFQDDLTKIQTIVEDLSQSDELIKKGYLNICGFMGIKKEFIEIGQFFAKYLDLPFFVS